MPEKKPEENLPIEALFNQNERALIDQAQQIIQGAHSESIDLVRARLRNLIAKYQEMAKRERMRGQVEKSAERVRQLQALMDQLSPPS